MKGDTILKCLNITQHSVFHELGNGRSSERELLFSTLHGLGCSVKISNRKSGLLDNLKP